MLLTSWSLSEQNALENTGTRIFRKVFSLDPAIEHVFAFTNESQPDASNPQNSPPLPPPPHAKVVEGSSGRRRTGHNPSDPYKDSFYKHIRVFMNILEIAVSKMDNLKELKPMCVELGRRHYHFGLKGFRPEFWPTFQQAMIDCAFEWEQTDGSTEEHRAAVADVWRRLVSYIIHYMRVGYDEEMRKSEAKAEVPKPLGSHFFPFKKSSHS